jgi:hypothetical protein
VVKLLITDLIQFEREAVISPVRGPVIRPIVAICIDAVALVLGCIFTFRLEIGRILARRGAGVGWIPAWQQGRPSKNDYSQNN